MGAWGTGSFDNDAALDLVAELEEDGAEPITIVINDVLEEVRGTPADELYLDSDLAAATLAVVDIWVSAHGHPPAGALDEGVKTVLEQHGAAIRELPLTKQTVSDALAAATGEKSELKELWDDSDHAAGWAQAVADLAKRLAAVGG